jgi:hypothetical protein
MKSLSLGVYFGAASLTAYIELRLKITIPSAVVSSRIVPDGSLWPWKE